MKSLMVFIIALLNSIHPGIAQKHESKPNIIFILADDLGYGDVGCYGQQKIETPNIDRLAKIGVRFTQFYSGSTVCAPARCSFMTGMHTGHTVIRGNVGMQPEGQFPLPDSVTTIAMIFQQNGYRTAAFGKWGLGFITTPGDPQKKGFDEFYGYNCQSLAHNYYPDHLWHNHIRIDLPGNLISDSIYSADLIHQQAMKFLSRLKRDEPDKPFFLYLPYTLPHAELTVPHDSVYEYYVQKFKVQPVKKPGTIGNEKHDWDQNPHAAFAAMVSRLDKYVGEIMDALKGIEQSTLIIFTSDNGPHQENGGDPAFFNSNGGLRGIKRDLYEGGIRVPFIAYKKGMTKEGTVNEMPCTLYDLYPTFLQLANIPIKARMDGNSILPALMGKKQEHHEYIYWEFHEGGGKQAVRMGEWKAVRLNVSKNIRAPLELYNLKDDPFERHDLASKHQEILHRMEQIIYIAHQSNAEWPFLPKEIKK